MQVMAFIRYWTLKRLTILVGFILSLLGSVGGYAYVAPVEKKSDALGGQIKTAEANIEILKNADASYWNFQQQGALIFAIYNANTRDEARPTIGALMKLAMVDRTFSIRTVIGQLAIANQLNYRQTSDQYQALVDKARDDFTFTNYMAVNLFEKAFMQRAEKMSGDLQQQRLVLMTAKDRVDAEADHRRLVLLILTALGSTFLLAANLITTRENG
jgi:hypothetical protein